MELSSSRVPEHQGRLLEGAHNSTVDLTPGWRGPLNVGPVAYRLDLLGALQGR